MGQSGKGAWRWPEEDPGAFNTSPPPLLFFACLSLLPSPFLSLLQTSEVKRKQKSAWLEGTSVWMGWGRRGRGWVAVPMP